MSERERERERERESILQLGSRTFNPPAEPRIHQNVLWIRFVHVSGDVALYLMLLITRKQTERQAMTPHLSGSMNCHHILWMKMAF